MTKVHVPNASKITFQPKSKNVPISVSERIKFWSEKEKESFTLLVHIAHACNNGIRLEKCLIIIINSSMDNEQNY